MARIRSLHPGFWTDKVTLRLMAENPMALFALQGLWGEADDHGIFDWEPYSLKARIFPTASVDVGALLDVLVEVNAIKKVTIDGLELGVVRNFMVYQTPRRPSFKHPETPDVLTYAGFNRKKSRQEEGLSEDDSRQTPTSNGHDSGQMTEQLPPLAASIPDNDRKVTAIGVGEGVGEDKEGNKGASHPRPRDEAAIAVSMWNKTAEKLKLPLALTKISETRLGKLNNRLSELDGLEGWAMMLAKIEASPHLRGDNDRGWTATIDWVLEPRNLTKIMEDNYATRPSARSKTGFAGLTEDFVRGLSESGPPSGERGQG